MSNSKSQNLKDIHYLHQLKPKNNSLFAKNGYTSAVKSLKTNYYKLLSLQRLT